MPILLARVDDRLIHGQVVVGWASSLKANHIVVINDEAAGSDVQKLLFRMATPTEIKLSVLTVAEAALKINGRAFDDEDTILLFKNPQDPYEMIKAGGRISELNIGGMHFFEGKWQLCDAVFVDDNDIETFKLLDEMKVLLEVRMVPTDAKRDIMKVIEEKTQKKK